MLTWATVSLYTRVRNLTSATPVLLDKEPGTLRLRFSPESEVRNIQDPLTKELQNPKIEHVRNKAERCFHDYSDPH